MDAPYYNGAPDAMPYDREHGDLSGRPEMPEVYTCRDCGDAGEQGFTSVITHDGQSRIYCSACKTRRGLEYKFDPRSWQEIEREQRGSAA